MARWQVLECLYWDRRPGGRRLPSSPPQSPLQPPSLLLVFPLSGVSGFALVWTHGFGRVSCPPKFTWLAAAHILARGFQIWNLNCTSTQYFGNECSKSVRPCNNCASGKVRNVRRVKPLNVYYCYSVIPVKTWGINIMSLYVELHQNTLWSKKNQFSFTTSKTKGWKTSWSGKKLQC